MMCRLDTKGRTYALNVLSRMDPHRKVFSERWVTSSGPMANATKSNRQIV